MTSSTLDRSLTTARATLAALATLVLNLSVLLDVWDLQVLALLATFALTIWTLVHFAAVYDDALNTISAFMILVLIRLVSPTVVVLLSGAPINHAVNFMRIQESEWIEGAMLASSSVAALVLGWLINPFWLTGAFTRRYSKLRSWVRMDVYTSQVGHLFLAVGVVMVALAFVLSFGTVFGAVQSGVARTSDSRSGSTRYVFVGLALIYTAAVVAVRRNNKRALRTLAPAAVAVVILSPLGGRVGALTPLVLACLVYRYLGPVRKIRMSRLLPAIAAGLLLISVFATFLVEYRGGGGIAGGANAVSVDGVGAYLDLALWQDIGALHPYALGVRKGPDSLLRSVYPGMTGTLGSVFGIESSRVGEEFARDLNAISDRVWGLHSGMAIDVYVDSGLWPAIIVMILFGMFLRAEYAGFRSAPVSLAASCVHAVILWTAVWMFFESIVVVSSFLVPIVPGLLAAGAIAQVVRGDRSRTFEVPAVTGSSA